jgi:hypothetical protein
VLEQEKAIERRRKKTRRNRLVVNSESSHECWFIENPSTKDLTKKITLKLGAKCEQEFIIVLRAPARAKRNPLVSFLNLNLATTDEDDLEKHWRSKHQDMSWERFEQKKSTKVMMIGTIEPPRLECPKSVFDSHSQKRIIPIALKQAPGTQKFRIPFINKSAKDLDIEFSFVKIAEKREEVSMNEYLEFFCMPGTLKIN